MSRSALKFCCGLPDVVFNLPIQIFMSVTGILVLKIKNNGKVFVGLNFIGN